jgi:hypothetical protein
VRGGARPRTFGALARRSFPIWFGGIWLLCGVPFLIVGVYVGIDTLREQERYASEAQVTQGMVLTKRISRGSQESTTYWVRYRFEAPDGAEVTSETKVSGALWDRLVEREPVRITYLRDRPGAHRIEDQGSDWVLPVVFTVLGSVFVPLGGWIVSRGFKGIAKP